MEGNAGQVGAAAPGTGQAPTGAPAPVPTPPAAVPLRVPPNQYHLAGGGVTVSYFPDGRGPIGPAGAIHLVYQDAHHTLTFTKDQVRTDDVSDLGTLLSVTLTESIDIGSTTFTLVLPDVELPDTLGSSAQIRIDGITTTHRIFAGAIGHAQAQSYEVTYLSGTAAFGILEA